MASWKTRRRRRLTIIYAVVAAVGAASSALLLPWIGSGLVELFWPKLWAALMALPSVKAWAAGAPLISATLGGALAVWGFRPALRGAHDRWFADFDDDVLGPLRWREVLQRDAATGEALERQLPWREPASGPRFEVWGRLIAWALSDSVEPSRRWPWEAPQAKLLKVHYLVGRAGGGKTRLAEELGRKLANRKAYGDQGGTRRPARGRLSRLAEWSRTQVSFLNRRPDDAWDAAMVRGEDIAGVRADGGWRPRRPTLLIFDDPSPGEVLDLRGALQAASKRWRHPVRLLVVSQGAPTTDGLRWNAATSLWEADKVALDPQPERLTEEAWFTRDEVERYLGDPALTSLQVMKLMRRPGVLDQAMTVTKGNPLLVALAVTWLKDGAPFDEMTPQSLLKARAERVMRVLEGIGVTAPGQREALAVATLAGGARRADLHRACGEAPGAENLRALFPADGADLWTEVPPFHPELVGEAIVRRVINGVGEGCAERLVEAAWRVAPLRMLRLRRRPRLAADPYDPTRPDPLSSAVRDVDPVSLAQVSRLDLVRADLEIGLYRADEEADFGARQDRRADILLMLRSIRALEDPDDVRAVSLDLSARIAGLAEEVKKGVRLDALAAAFLATFEGDGRLDAAESARLLAGIEMLCRAFEEIQPWTDPSVDDEIGRSVARALAKLDPAVIGDHELEALGDQLWRLPETSPAAAFGELARARPDAEAASYWEYAGQALSAMTDERPPPPLQEQERSDLAVRIRCAAAQAHAARPEGAGYAEAASLAVDVEWIVQNFADDASMQCEHAKALRHAAFAQVHRPDDAGRAEVERYLGRVGRIAARFPLDPCIHHQHAIALRYSTYVHGRVPDGMEAAEAERVAGNATQLASRFAAHPGIQREHAEALRNAAYAHCKRPEGSGAPDADRLARDVGRIASRFEENAAIHLRHATALAYVAYAHGQRPSGAGAPDAERLVAEVALIASRFTEDPRIHEVYAQALMSTAFAHSKRPEGEGSGEAERLAIEVGRIASTFTERVKAQQTFAATLRHAAQAHDGRPGGAGSAEAERLAAEVGRIATRFDRDVEICTEHARTLCAAVYAQAHRPEGVGAVAAERLAGQVSELASRFAGEPTIQFEHAVALRYAVYAQYRRPGDSGAADAKRLAEQVGGVASRFAAQAEFQQQYVYALSYAAHAYGPGAEFDLLVGQVAAIARQFPGDENIQSALADLRAGKQGIEGVV